MPWKICLPFPLPRKDKVPVKKEMVCFYIPTPIPIPIPKGDPGPWITKGVIDEKLARDLPILATIDALASQLSNATVRRTVQGSVQDAVDSKSLPENMKIEFK